VLHVDVAHCVPEFLAARRCRHLETVSLPCDTGWFARQYDDHSDDIATKRRAILQDT
jgi:hypothetical protein